MVDMMIREGYSVTFFFTMGICGETCSGSSMIHTGWWFGNFHNHDYIFCGKLNAINHPQSVTMSMAAITHQTLGSRPCGLLS